MNPVRVLVTNDDGIESEGLHALAAKLVSLGHDTVVAAPDRDQSGTAASLGRMNADEHLDARRVEIPGAPAAEAYAVAATPGLCVIAGRLGAFGPPPEVVVSGINAGTNLGRSILHSGTVGAVLTAQSFGAKGLAVSLQTTEAWHWHSATELTAQVLELLIDAPSRAVLNLNVPGLPITEIQGIRWAHLDAFGSVRSAVAESDDGRLQFELVATDLDPRDDTDRGLVAAGYASLTSIVGIAEAWPDAGVETPEIVERVVAGSPVEAVHDLDRSRLMLRRTETDRA